MSNIVLIGMPGAGKSSIGVLYAKAIGYGYIDSDLLIQAREKKLLREIIEEKGVDGFNRVEEEVNSEIWADRCVIATGGSVIYGAEAMAHLKEIGKIVYLELPYDEIARRLGDLKNRGVSIKEGTTLKELYDERVVLYKKYADLTVDFGGKSVEECVRALIEATKGLV